MPTQHGRLKVSHIDDSVWFCSWVGLALAWQDSALEEKWEAREAARRRELAHAQADYSKVKEAKGIEGNRRESKGEPEISSW